MKQSAYYFMLMALMFLLGITVVETYINYYPSPHVYQVPTTEQDIVRVCSNLSLEDTAECITGEIRTFYKYNITDNNIILDFNTLKLRGGDCVDYARLSDSIAKNLSLNSRTVTITINETLGHRFTVFSNDSGYCIIDQTRYSCIDLKT